VTVVECSEAIADDLRVLIGVPPTATQSAGTRYFVTDEVGTFNFLATAFLDGHAVNAVRIDSL
jgi:hypothetical protein